MSRKITRPRHALVYYPNHRLRTLVLNPGRAFFATRTSLSIGPTGGQSQQEDRLAF